MSSPKRIRYAVTLGRDVWWYRTKWKRWWVWLWLTMRHPFESVMTADIELPDWCMEK